MADEPDHRFRKFDKMHRLLDGEDASVSMISADALPRPGLSPRLADEAFALLAHRTQIRPQPGDTPEEVARRVREALERPLRDENAELRKLNAELEQQLKAAGRRSSAPKQRSRDGLLDFQARLVIEAAEALAVAAEGQPALGAADGLGEGLRRLVDRVMLFHRAEDRLDGDR